MSSTYIELVIAGDALLLEHLVGVLSQLGVEGFWEDGDRLKCYVSEERWSAALHEEIKAVVHLVARSSTSTVPSVAVHSIEDQNWNEQWEKTITPIHVGRFLIAPSWHEAQPGPGEILLAIDPKMSFGTGYHESTRLALRLLEKYIRPGMRLLDVGTGTGVLAIAGVKLGAVDSVGLDIDEWSYANAVENVRLNGVQGIVRIQQGELKDGPAGPFDLIAANIQLNVLVDLLEEMAQRLAPKGVVVLSGLLAQDRELMSAALTAKGFSIIEELTENGWLAIVSHRA